MTKLGQLGLCALVIAIAACTSDPFDATPDQGPGLTSQPEGGWTVLTPAKLGNSALTTAVLNSSGAAAMGGTADARVVLMYAVMCALGSTQTVTFTVGGTTYNDTGILGIATGWTSSALSASEAAWVSSC